jgi:hypothetical protein
MAYGGPIQGEGSLNIITSNRRVPLFFSAASFIPSSLFEYLLTVQIDKGFENAILLRIASPYSINSCLYLYKLEGDRNRTSKQGPS